MEWYGLERRIRSNSKLNNNMKKIIFIAIALLGFLSNAQQKVVVRNGNVYNEVVADSLVINGKTLSEWVSGLSTEILYNPNLIEIGGQSNAFGFAGNSTYPLDSKYSYSITNETPLTYVASGGKDSDYNLITLEVMDFENSKGWENVNILEAYGIEYRLFEILKDYYNEDFYMIKTSQPSTQLVEAGGSTIDWSVNSTDEYYEWSNDHHDSAVALMPSQLAPAYYIWIQGEEDISQDVLSSYQEELEDFIAAKRAYYNYPEMPFLIVRMGNLQTFYNDDIAEFRAIQETVASQDYNILIDADGAATQDDNIHYTDVGYELIAERIATAMGVDFSLLPSELTGTVFGSPHFSNNAVYAPDKAFDGGSGTYFASDGSTEDLDKYVGIDLGSGNEAKLTKALLLARDGFETRMQGAVVQGSNTSETDGFVTLSSAVGTDNVEDEYYQLNITDETAYRYYRVYLSGVDFDISEIVFNGY